MPTVSALIPCLNEEETLGLCIVKARDCFLHLGIDGEVVVADNGSTDRSVEIAESLGARVVHQSKRGYGAALMAGIDAARSEFIIMGDADDSYDWGNMGPFITKLGEGYELVMGNRFAGGIEQGAMPALHRYLGNPVLSYVARKVSGASVRDFHCGMRAFTKDAYRRMELSTPGMEFASEMVIHAARNSLRIGEIPIQLHRDKRSRPSHLRSFRDGWRHLRFIMTYAPNQVFLFPGLGTMGLGLLLQALLVRGPANLFGFPLGIHFLALGCLLTLAGFNVLNLGVLGKVIVERKHPHLGSRVAHWVAHRFSLEGGLIAGAILVLAGLLVDASILLQWLVHIGKSQEQTVHLAFVASTTIVLGFNIIFSAFLLNLLISEDRTGH